VREVLQIRPEDILAWVGGELSCPIKRALRRSFHSLSWSVDANTIEVNPYLMHGFDRTRVPQLPAARAFVNQVDGFPWRREGLVEPIASQLEVELPDWVEQFRNIVPVAA
jgi:hypothetical protein